MLESKCGQIWLFLKSLGDKVASAQNNILGIGLSRGPWLIFFINLQIGFWNYFYKNSILFELSEIKCNEQNPKNINRHNFRISDTNKKFSPSISSFIRWQLAPHPNLCSVDNRSRGRFPEWKTRSKKYNFLLYLYSKMMVNKTGLRPLASIFEKNFLFICLFNGYEGSKQCLSNLSLSLSRLFWLIPINFVNTDDDARPNFLIQYWSVLW